MSLQETPVVEAGELVLNRSLLELLEVADVLENRCGVIHEAARELGSLLAPISLVETVQVNDSDRGPANHHGKAEITIAALGQRFYRARELFRAVVAKDLSGPISDAACRVDAGVVSAPAGQTHV